MKRFTALMVAVMIVAAAVPAWSFVAQVEQITDNAVQYNQAAISPDGKWVVYQKDDAVASYTLWKMRTDGTGDVQLTTDAQTYCDSHPAWNKAGTKIAFQRYVSADGYASIWTMNPNGTGQKKVVDCVRDDAGDCVGCVTDPAWSPDGLSIAYKQDGDEDGTRYEYSSLRVKLVGSALSGAGKRVTPAFFGFAPHIDDIKWKPAGAGVNNIIAASLQNPLWWENASYYRNIALLNKANPLADRWLTNGYGYTCQLQLEWNKAGTKIAYKDDLYGQGDIWTMSQSGGMKNRITNTFFYDGEGTDVCYNNPVWHPSGKYVFAAMDENEIPRLVDTGITRNVVERWLVAIKADGSKRAKVAKLNNNLAFWAGDDAAVAGDWDTTDARHIMKFDSAGSKLLVPIVLGEWYDSNADGLKDAWRFPTYYNQLFVVTLDVRDTDGDGLKNWEEGLAWDADIP